MDYLFLGFVGLLILAGLGFLGYYIYKLDRTPEVSPRLRRINRFIVGAAGLIGLIGIGLGLGAASPLADWGLTIGLTILATAMLILAAEGFGVGFQQMDEDGIGFLRFFQLGSAIIFCMAFAPAFVAFIVYATRLDT